MALHCCPQRPLAMLWPAMNTLSPLIYSGSIVLERPYSSGSPTSSSTPPETHLPSGLQETPTPPSHLSPPSSLLPCASQIVRELRWGHLLRKILGALAQHQEGSVGQAGGGVALEGDKPGVSSGPSPWPGRQGSGSFPLLPASPPGRLGRPARLGAPPAASQ